MRGLPLAQPGKPLSVLCLGAHSDDIEIGAGATVLELTASGACLDVTWCVLSATADRAAEARASASDFLAGAERSAVEVESFRDATFPAQLEALRAWFEELKGRVAPDLIFTHRREDGHQDHRAAAQLTWSTFRDVLILEYEIPKWDGDLGQPNVFVPVRATFMARKLELLLTHFTSQRDRGWFEAETFESLARLRGMECRAPERFAEAFHARKLVLQSEPSDRS